ncbi:MAG: ABC transporter ATP-binding protein [Betaproteobacteria bacterium]|nr:ABC transporter ATP-binding protein [Betaproteobacteria bacterium]
MALLELRNITRRFGELRAVDDVNIAIEAGEFFTLLGPSGCGKTTLLRMIAGFDRPDAGSILLDGRDIGEMPPEKRPVHTVFQSYALFPHMTVAQNVAFPLRMAGKPAVEIATRVAEALEQVHLEELAQRYPDEVSGGQKQRVALARALVNRPRMLLLDEPLGALDAKLRERMQIELIALQREVGITFVFVTHSQPEALALSHRIAVMNDGRIEQIDTPSRLYGFPRNRFVADFIGNCNLLGATVVETTAHELTLDLRSLGRVVAPAAGNARVGQQGAFALRPEQVRITPAAAAHELRNHFVGKVHDLLYVGDVTTYVVELPGGLRLEALLANSAPGRARVFEIGETVRVAWRHDAGSFLPE